MKIKLILLVFLMLTMPAEAKDLYKCVDGKKFVYQTSPCQINQNETVLDLPDSEDISDDSDSQSSTIEPKTTHNAVNVKRDEHGRIKRSESAKNAFKKSHPCPANGHDSGACPGYVIDHIKALACGGADDPSNMQWQTVEEGKAKDKWERKGCDASAPSSPKKPQTTSKTTESYSGNHSGNYSGNGTIYTGPRGGKYTITPDGHKHYLPKH